MPEVLDELPNWARTVRVRHLLHHTTGLPELTESPAIARDNDEVLTRQCKAGPSRQAR
jgi:CubicO group peptidase (beta-lactamase class C family)